VDRDDILTELMALEQGILESVVIKGVRNVERAVLEPPKPVNKTYDPAADAFVDNPEWRILTAGTNLVDVMANPYVDYTRTETNDISEVYRVLGIEAARAALLNELRNVMWMADQHNVNYRHMALLVDTMTNRGHLVSIDRHGINKGDNGPLAKSSFEETDEMLIRAGIFCELDRINGVSANIMIGQVPPCGTGEGDVFVDVDAITQHVREADIHAGFGHAGREAIRATTSAEGEERERERSANAAPDVKLPEKDAGVIAQEEDAVVIV
jgi:DNA-directed RNA polymerase II subunit RPB1